MSSYKYVSRSQPFGLGTEIPFSSAWYDRLRQEELRLGRMGKRKAFENDPAWLMLPLARRQVALQRLAVMQEYERHEKPGDAEAEHAAQRLGVTTGQFYRIRRQWSRKRDVFDLLPYGRPGTVRRPKLDQDVSDALSDLIKKAVATDGLRAPMDIMRAVEKQWELDKPIPSHMTIRKNIADALERLTNISGGLVLVNSTIPKEALASATGFGEVLAIDHLGLQVFVASEGGPVAPIITLAIDLFTSSIAGAHLSFGAPGPLQFMAVLKDAETRTAKAVAPGAEPIKPRLVFEAGGVSGWSHVIRRIEKGEFNANIRRSQRINFGEAIGNLIGPSIGDVKFAPRRILNDLVFNPGRDPLIKFDELRKLLRDGIQLLNEKRLPPDIELRPLLLDL